MNVLALLLLLQVRTYWPVTLDSTTGRPWKHSHVAVSGTVTVVKLETDGDTHIWIRGARGATLLGECIPKLPCAAPRVGQSVTLRGISRWDPEHKWAEVHPVEEVGP